MTLAQSDSEVFDIAEEIKSIYGKIPPEVDHLVEVMVIRRWLKGLGVSALSAAVQATGEIKMALAFVPDAPIDRSVLAEKLQIQPHRYRLTSGERLAVTVDTLHNPNESQFLRMVRGEVVELYESLVQTNKGLTKKSA